MTHHFNRVLLILVVCLFLPSVNSAQNVYICTSRGAKSYHKTARCAGANCSREIACVTLAEAQKLRRQPCRRCLRGFTPPQHLVINPFSTRAADLSRIELARTPNGRRSQVIQHLGYTASYNASWLVSNWVAYQLTPQEAKGTVKRPKRQCDPDPMVKGTSASHSDFTNSGYCRGHLAPAMDMKWNEEAMNESFYLTNICPQTEALNNGLWRRIEERLHRCAEQGDTLYICSGPYMPQKPQRIGTNRVAVPTYCFKVVCMRQNGCWYAIGFVLPNAECKGPMMNYAMSVDDVENFTGIDFFYNLPDAIESEIESKVVRKVWGL